MVVGQLAPITGKDRYPLYPLIPEWNQQDFFWLMVDGSSDAQLSELHALIEKVELSKSGRNAGASEGNRVPPATLNAS